VSDATYAIFGQRYVLMAKRAGENA